MTIWENNRSRILKVVNADKKSVEYFGNAFENPRLFTLDDYASVKLRNFAIDFADLIMENVDFAIPPYTTTYVEFKHEVFNKLKTEAGRQYGTGIGFFQDQSIDRILTCGVMIHQTPKGTHFIPMFDDNGKVDALPFICFKGNEKGTANTEFDVVSKMLLIGAFGSDIADKVELMSDDYCLGWTIGNQMTVDEIVPLTKLYTGAIFKAVALLLLLNQKRGIQTYEKPGYRKIVKGKLRPYKAQTVVNIDFSAKEFRRNFDTGTRGHNRGHSVRGHFVHYHHDKQCSHNYVRVDEEPRTGQGKVIKRWRCENCSTIRVFREEFNRGDASLGWVSKRYKLTDSQRKREQEVQVFLDSH